MSFQINEIGPSYELYINDYNTEICNFSFNFPLKKIFDNSHIHLLEHVLLHDTSIKHKLSNKKFSSFVNGLTTASCLSFTINCHISDIIECVQYLLQKIYKVEDINEDIIKNEILMTQLEEQKYYRNNFYAEFENIYEEAIPQPKELSLKDLYEEIIINNTCIIIGHADTHHVKLRDTLNIIRTQFNYQAPHEAVENIFVSINNKYISQHQSGDDVKIRLTIPAPFFKKISYYLLTYYILKEGLTDFIRFQDNNDYSFRSGHKHLIYAFEFFIAFQTDRTNESLLQIIQNVLLLESNFSLYQEIIYKFFLCNEFHPQAFPSSVSSILYNDQAVLSMKEIAKDMKNIKYDDYVKRSTKRIDNIFIERHLG